MSARSTLSRRRIAVLLLAASGLLVAAGVLADLRPAPRQTGPAVADGAGEADEAGEARAGGPAPAATAPPRRAREPVMTVLGPSEPPTSETEVIEGQQVAADFVSAFASYRFDDGPGATLERVRGYVTPELAEALADGDGGGAAGQLELAERRESAAAQVESVQPQVIGDGWMDLLVVVRSDVSSDEGDETRWGSYLTRVVRSADGWRVAGFQP